MWLHLSPAQCVRSSPNLLNPRLHLKRYAEPREPCIGTFRPLGRLGREGQPPIAGKFILLHSLSSYIVKIYLSQKTTMPILDTYILHIMPFHVLFHVGQCIFVYEVIFCKLVLPLSLMAIRKPNSLSDNFFSHRRGSLL